MTNRKVVHEVKLETSVKIILGVLAIGVGLNAILPAFSVQEALAAMQNISGSLTVFCTGCS
ncbi:MAG: hypothetical protein VX564_05640 [Nitrospirota bacterium]|nr:hypothetical protein [Nitrospirota bacterium]